MKKFLLIALLWAALVPLSHATAPYVLMLGVAQDGGYPQMGCTKTCCAPALKNSSLKKFVVSFALVDPAAGQWWLFEATPDIREQLQYFNEQTGSRFPYLPAGIFITHAHIGHYTGLMQLGREVINSNSVPVFALSKMSQFLSTNGPWSQLVGVRNIDLRIITPGTPVNLTGSIQVSAFTVPHRDEFSETAGFHIKTSEKSYLFIPDIDKWEKWDKDIRREVRQVTIALLDGTFTSADELPGRNMSEVPHPLVAESIKLFQSESDDTRKKVFLVHFNHTNPLLWDLFEQEKIKKTGFNVALQGMQL